MPGADAGGPFTRGRIGQSIREGAPSLILQLHEYERHHLSMPPLSHELLIGPSRLQAHYVAGTVSCGVGVGHMIVS